MAQTTPPTITASPAVPLRGDKVTFSNRVDAFLTWLAAAVTQFGAVATNVYGNAVDAFNSAVAAAGSASAASGSAAAAQASADASVVASGVTAWVSGTTYAVGNVRYSPIDYRSYRRKTAGAGTTDPSADVTNWVGISVEAPLAVATVGSAVANIDFLNLFSQVYDKYVIEIQGVTPSAVDYLYLRLASGGAADASASYGSTSTDASTISAGSTGLNLATGGAVGAGSTAPCTLTIEIRNANATTNKSLSARGQAGGKTTIKEAIYTGTAAVSGFRLFWAEGSNFTAGKVRVYGVRAN